MSYWYLLTVVLVTSLTIAIYFCVKFALIVLRVQETLQESINIIDEKQEKIEEILARPLFYDSPEVRRVLGDIEDVRGALYDIAVGLSKDFEEKEESQELQ